MVSEVNFAAPQLKPHRIVAKEQLSNQDFRRLLLTPRTSDSDQIINGAAASYYATIKKQSAHLAPRKATTHKRKHNPNAEYFKERAKAEAELAAKYRDRAKERREGTNLDYKESEELIKKIHLDLQDRELAYEESKFLGGDLQHTHLVKGLDYALLQKSRNELLKTALEREKLKENTIQSDEVFSGLAAPTSDGLKEGFEACRTRLGKNICKVLFNRLRKRNELFQPGRMAYVFDLTDSEDIFDPPTTVLRSLADLTARDDYHSGSHQDSSNDIVIEKLQQIFLYTRQGLRGRESKKNRKLKKAVVSADSRDLPDNKLFQKETIFSEDEADTTLAGEEVNSTSTFYKADLKNYFEVYDLANSKVSINKVRDKEFTLETAIKDLEDDDNVPDHNINAPAKHQSKKPSQFLSSRNEMEESYLECYPNSYAADVSVNQSDSDGEPDFTKMDSGSKRAHLKRWDFETEVDWEKHKEKAEAVPKCFYM
jgi:IK cytokine